MTIHIAKPDAGLLKALADAGVLPSAPSKPPKAAKQPSTRRTHRTRRQSVTRIVVPNKESFGWVWVLVGGALLVGLALLDHANRVPPHFNSTIATSSRR